MPRVEWRQSNLKKGDWEMKKVIAVALAVALVVGGLSLAMPAIADPDVVFEASIVPGGFPAGETIDKGEAKVYAGGSFVIEIEGAQANETYNVLVGRWVGTAGGGKGVEWETLAVQLITDDEGEGAVSDYLPSGNWSLFALNDADNEEGTEGANRFVSGFEAP